MRILSRVLIVLVILTALFYFFSGKILEKVSEDAIDFVITNFEMPNVEHTRPQFKKVGFSSFNAITWHGVTMETALVEDEVTKKVVKSFIEIEEITVTLESIDKHTLLISLRGINAITNRSPENFSALSNISDNLEGGSLDVRIRFAVMSLKGIKAHMRYLADELKKFLKEGVTSIPIEFSGEEKVTVKGRTHSLKIGVKQDGDEYRLIVDEKSLRSMGNLGGRIPPTPGDYKVLSNYPLRLPRLLRIRNKAEDTAAQARMTEPGIPEDAYRHVLWAYLLTKAYGEDFATLCGNAHESEVSSEDARLQTKAALTGYQDFNNNAVGRGYASRGYAESDILTNVLTDPEVIRDNETAERYNTYEMGQYLNQMRQEMSIL